MIRTLLALGGGSSEPGGPLPPDPTLTADRHITQVTGINQNTVTPGGAGRTWRTEYRAATDFTTLRLAYGSFAQAILTAPWTASVTVETPDGELIPVTWSGGTSLSCDEAEMVESDPVALTLGEGENFWVRLHVPAGVKAPVARNGRACTYMEGNQLAATWAPVNDPAGDPESPLPVAAIGKARPSTIVPAMIGDSICAMGIEPAGWWRLALGLTPGLSYGRNARRFTDLDGREGNTLRAATHVLVQYGANDLGSSPTVAATWATAVAHYAYVNDQNPGVGIWQTTCTPIVGTTDECATLAGQTTYSTTREAWNAFLRDGAPCNPTTKAALAVGASGLRAGQDGHPLQGVVDVAEAVEQGGTSSPTGKWRVDLGPLGGDGVHPSNLGMTVMAEPVEAWVNTLA